MIDKIYIIHYKYLDDRKRYLDNQLKNILIPYEFIINDKESDDIKINNIDRYYLYDANVFNRKLSKGELCVSISHFDVYNKILKDNINNALIIEDDALFADNFLDNLLKITNEMSQLDYDMCFISECCNLHTKKKDGVLLYPVETSRCVTGYIVNSKNLKLITDSIPFQYPIDWHLNQIKEKLKLKYFWSEPCLIIQGSENIYKSNLR